VDFGNTRILTDYASKNPRTFVKLVTIIRATSNTRLRARDHNTPSALIGENNGANPSSLHTTLEKPTEYMNAQWMQSLHGFLHDIEWIVFHGHLDYHFLEVSLTPKPGDPSTPKSPNR
jgi:hypothetical protein